jgi:hypothetical protein
MSPEYVLLYAKSNKNDDLDADAASQPTMRFTRIKTKSVQLWAIAEYLPPRARRRISPARGCGQAS